MLQIFLPDFIIQRLFLKINGFIDHLLKSCPEPVEATITAQKEIFFTFIGLFILQACPKSFPASRIP
jgi:hypothetical protein